MLVLTMTEKYSGLCYDSSVAPKDIKHNCALWEYDHGSGVYVDTMTMRSIVQYATPLLFFKLMELLPVAVGGVGLKVVVPFMSFKVDALLMLNDNVLYPVFGDQILAATQSVNNMIGKIKFTGPPNDSEVMGDIQDFDEGL